jgi:hypothetical protein
MSKTRKLRQRISSAHIIAMIALFVALSGSSYAAVTIRASQIRNNSIPGSKIKANSLPASKLKNNSITGAKLRNNSVGRADLRTDALNGNTGTGGGNVGAQGGDGTAGPRGPQGPSGPRGLTGSSGAPGAPGANGQDGAAGANAQGMTTIAAPGTLDPETGTGTVTASCPAGTVAVGGNYTGDAARSALATLGETTYSVAFSGPLGGSVVVYVVCS